MDGAGPVGVTGEEGTTATDRCECPLEKRVAVGPGSGTGSRDSCVFVVNGKIVTFFSVTFLRSTKVV